MCGGTIGFLLRTKVEIWGRGGGAYPEIMFNYFWKLNFFSATDAVVVDMSASQHKGKTIKKKNNRGFVIPVPKSANRTFFLTRGFYCSIPYFCVFSISLGVQPKTS